ncbi:beta strand repeat-containing protein [Methanobrevibacter arboriphilus]|uniref:Uncharacterized protein n=1 Tax=Methanobrevibacter arboriphilus TaxID=39441 RepID=A0ACA8R4B5_METAZ|nr:Ig-like domain-containing protein [Methanobrevibacter arboriphilus]BBL62254.1 hypothetical protein MarbSA_12940 [Methanobrevibacter arboriphilus]
MKKNNFFIISALLIICLFLGLASVSAASSDIYVSPNGNDTSNNGTVDSPYHSIGKAVNQSSNSSNVNIYLDEGTYRGKGNNTEIVINKAHISQGGSISIIGKGKDKTFIDGDSSSFLFDIKADSIVYLYNLTIRNCKNTNGGAILNYGNLSITNCNFENNYATSSGGAIYSEYGANLNVVNSVFNNNYAASYGGVIFGYIIKLNNCNFTNNIVDSNIIYSSDANSFVYNCYFINNTINSTSSWIYSTLYMYGGSIVNNTFINCSAPNSDSTPILYIGGTIYLKNNTVINCFNKNNLSFIKSDWANFNSNLTFLGNSTVNINKPSNIRLTALLTDDMGNAISGGTVYFIINGILNKSNSTNASGIATYTFTQLFNDGLYVVSGYVGSENLTSVRTGIINVSIDRSPVTYYVSNSGNDDTGNGSQDNPFKTIKKAIDQGFAVSIYPTIMIMEGTYKGVGNTNLSFSDLGILNIIGVYNKTIIDGEFIGAGFKFGSYIQSNIINMTFINCSPIDSFGAAAIYASGFANITNCIFKNNSRQTVLYMDGGSNVINSTFIDNNVTSLYMRGGLIENSSFINNNATSGIAGMPGSFSSYNFTVRNSMFINNTLTSSSTTGILGGGGYYTTINNTFINNSVPNSRSVVLGGGSFNSFDDIFIDNKGVDGGITASSANFTNAKFINNSVSGNGSVVYVSNGAVVDFVNCTFDGNTAGGTGNPIFISSSINSVGTLTTGQVKRINVTYHSLYTNKFSFTLTAHVTDAEGNIIEGGYLRFYANDKYLGIAPIINGTATLTYIGLENGNYTITGDCPSGVDVSITTGNLEVNAVLKTNSTFYVSPNGSDSTGDGSKGNPFKTINYALIKGYGDSKNVFIYLLEGVYTGVGNENLELPGDFNVTIIGNNSVISDINNTLRFITSKEGPGIHKLINLTLQNSRSIPGNSQIAVEYGLITNHGYLEIINCIFYNNTNAVIKNNGTMIIRNSHFNSNKCDPETGTSPISTRLGVIDNGMGNLTIYDSIFDSNNYTLSGSDIRNPSNLLIVNTIFNNSLSSGIFHSDFSGFGIGNTTLINSSIINSVAVVTNRWGSGGSQQILNVYNCKFENNTRFDNLYGVTVFLTAVNSIFNNTGSVIKLWNNSVISNCIFVNTNNSTGNLTKGNLTFNFNDNRGCNLTVTNSAFATYLYVISNTQVSEINLNYNWWGANDKPDIIINGQNYTIEYWIVMALVNSGNSGLTQSISVVPKVTDDNGTLYDYDTSSVPIPPEDREFTWEVVNDTGYITPNTGNVSDSGFNSTFTGIGYGNHTVKAVFDTFNTSKTFELYILGSTTNVTVSNPTGKNGSTIIITANVKDNQGNPVNGGIVEFLFNGISGSKSLGYATVKDGVAEFIWIVNEPNFNNGEVYAEYHENDAYTGSVDTTDFTVLTVPTNLTIDLSKVSGNRGDKVLITVNVRDNQENPITSGFVEVYVNGVYLGTFDVVDGKAYANWTVSGNPGKVSVMANYTDDYTYVDNQKTTNFEINKIKTSTSMSNYKGTYGKNTVLKATLKDANGKAVVGRYVKFYVNNKYVGQAKTNSQGLAALNYKVKNTGSLTIKAISVSDSTYQSSTRSSKLSVPKLSKVKIKNSYAVKGKKITFKTLLANFGPDKSSLVISYKLPKGVKLLKRSLTSGLVKYNKRTGILSWTVKNLKLSKSKSALLTISLSAKKGKYYIKNSVKKSAGSLVYGNNALKNIRVK